MTAVREQLQGAQSGIVLVADIEGLAALDERHGYASGNLILCELARILGRRGTAGRLGGDALALWAALPFDGAEALATAVRDDVHTRFSADGVTVDVALGSAPAGPGDDVATVLHAAGVALEQARTLVRSSRAA